MTYSEGKYLVCFILITSNPQNCSVDAFSFISCSQGIWAGFLLVLVLVRVIITTGSMRRFLNPTEVAQVVQLLKDGTSTHAVARTFKGRNTLSQPLDV